MADWNDPIAERARQEHWARQQAMSEDLGTTAVWLTTLGLAGSKSVYELQGDNLVLPKPFAIILGKILQHLEGPKRKVRRLVLDVMSLGPERHEAMEAVWRIAGAQGGKDAVRPWMNTYHLEFPDEHEPEEWRSTSSPPASPESAHDSRCHAVRQSSAAFTPRIVGSHAGVPACSRTPKVALGAASTSLPRSRRGSPSSSLTPHPRKAPPQRKTRPVKLHRPRCGSVTYFETATRGASALATGAGASGVVGAGAGAGAGSGVGAGAGFGSAAVTLVSFMAAGLCTFGAVVTDSRRVRNERRRGRRKEARDVVESAFRLGGKKAAWELVVANQKRVRCPQCSGKAIERNGGGCACGGTGVLDPRHCANRLRLAFLTDPVVRALAEEEGAATVSIVLIDAGSIPVAVTQAGEGKGV